MAAIAAAALAFIRADPLKAALIAGIAVTGSLLAWKAAVTIPLLNAEVKAERSRGDRIEAEHQRQVASAQWERAEASERYRKLEQESAAELQKLRKEIADAIQERRKADARADAARVLYDDAEARYVAEQARRAAADPAAACRIDGETVAMFRELRRETDQAAGESSEAADGLRDQVIGLQEYVRRACKNSTATTSGAGGSALSPN